MCSGQLVGGSPPFNGEQLGSVGTVQLRESVHGNPRGSGYELKESSAHLTAHRKNRLLKLRVNCGLTFRIFSVPGKTNVEVPVDLC